MKTKERQLEKIVDSLFTQCKVITNTASDVLHHLLVDLRLYPPSDMREKVLDIVKTYKKTRTQLEMAVDQIHALLYPPTVETPSETISDSEDWGSP